MKPHRWSVALLACLVLAGAARSEVQIEDDRGRCVTLKTPPQRLISLYGGLTEILLALGMAPHLVARTLGDDLAPNHLPTVGTHLQPNVEMIIALKPDLVAQGGVPKGLAALEKLEKEGVAVAMFSPRDFAGLFTVIRRLGVLTGQSAAAEAAVAAMEKQLAKVARLVAGKKPPTVFFEVRYPNLLGAGQGSIVHDIITRAGGRNILDSPQKLASSSLEPLLAADPEVYIIQQGPMNKSPQDIYQRPNFQELRAVRQRRVLVVEESLFSRPGPRSAAAVEQLARFLHPDGWNQKYQK